VLIARDSAIELALRRWGEATQSRGELLLVAGESGIGKTRLLSELVARTGVARSPKAGAFPRETDAPGAILLNLADDLHRHDNQEFARKIRARLLTESAGPGDPARKRRILLSDLSEILTDMLASSSMLLRLEDLHWADELSLDVLDRVAAELPALPSLVVATYRSDDLFGRPLEPWRARLLQQRLAEEVRLARLDLVQTGELVTAITGTVAPTSFVEALYRSSDGIPLHIEELVATGSNSAVLETVADAVLARFAQLDEPSRDIVAAASVIGRWFDLDLLERVTSTDADAVQAAIRKASNYQVLRSHAAGESFGFRHSIVCDVVYTNIPASRRASLHGAVARAAEKTTIGEAYISEHFEKAGEYELAYSHALAAAADAARVSAHRQASALYLRAVRTMPDTIDPRERADLTASLAVELEIVDEIAEAAALFSEAITLYHQLGDELAAARLVPRLMATRHLLGSPMDERAQLGIDALARIEGRDEPGADLAQCDVLAALAAAFMLDRRLDESLEYGTRASRLASAAHATTQLIDIDNTVGSVLVFAGRGPEGWPLLEGAIEAAQAESLEGFAARGLRMIASCASVLVEYERARTWLRTGLEYTRRTEHENDYNYLLAHEGHVAWCVGDLVHAEESAQRALADGLGITTRITALIVLGYVELARGDTDKARAFLGDALVLGAKLGEVQRVSPALWGLAEVHLRLGDAGAAAGLCERAVSASERVGDAAYAFPFVVSGTRALIALREFARAHEWLARCAALLSVRSIPGTLSAIDHARGLIELAEGHTGLARVSLESARAGWETSGRFWEGTAALHDLALCAHRSRRPADASRYRAEANATAHTAGALSLVNDSAIERPEGDGPLSAREHDVARLVASGLTNKQIAQSLTISPSTVSSHVEHILTKLGASRRAEIASWVVSSNSEARVRWLVGGEP
jgi:DNA-binding CsgD family transcriptional regulator/tetratricopeptide (TPR) repeat protein